MASRGTGSSVDQRQPKAHFSPSITTTLTVLHPHWSDIHASAELGDVYICLLRRY
jgi:hypothetical protein